MATQTGAPAFIPHLHAFRGVSIILITCAHAWSLPLYALRADDGTAATISFLMFTEMLFHDSTIFFALISGLLYSLVLRPKGYARFFNSKLVNVGAPYVVFTLLLTFVNWEFRGWLVIFDGSLSEYLHSVAANLVTGGASFPLWYIPVLIALFALTPLVDVIIDRPSLRWIAVVLVLAPLVLSRPEWPEKSWTSVAYFLGAYVAGMLAGRHYDETLAWCQRHVVLLAASLIVTSISIYYLLLNPPEPFGPAIWKESLWYLQKLAAAALILLALRAHEGRLPGWLATLAGYAFTIYFLNGFLTIMPTGWLVENIDGMPGVPFFALAGCILLIATLFVAVVFAWAVKRLTGRYSRMLIGA